MLMITDTAGTIAVGGVMGGANTEVNDGTTAVLLEAANFNFLSIRRTSGLLKLSSEAGSRFGKRVDPELTVKALARACELLAEVAGGIARPIYGDIYPGKPQPRSIELDPAYVNRLLGAEIPVEEMVRILEALEFQVRHGDAGTRGRGEPSPCHRVSLSPRHRPQPPPGHRHPRRPRRGDRAHLRLRPADADAAGRRTAATAPKRARWRARRKCGTS